jgi:hypothetical protein
VAAGGEGGRHAEGGSCPENGWYKICVSSFLDSPITDKWLFINHRKMVCTSHPVPASFEILIPGNIANK